MKLVCELLFDAHKRITVKPGQLARVGMLSEEVQEGARDWRCKEQVLAAANSVREVSARLERAEIKNEPRTKAQPVVWDWASSYQKFALWEDLDELREQKNFEEARLQTIMERNTNMGHYHDHSEERKLFELPEPDKMSICERHRLLGNVFHDEGCMHKATESYKLALSYYEYCFPESEEQQHKLDVLRYACLCNISLCYRRMSQFRLAVESASKALSLGGSDEGGYRKTKAYFRRAQAYCGLDEYANAQADLRAALALTPNDAVLVKELELLGRIKARGVEAEKRLAKSMLHPSLLEKERGGGRLENLVWCDFSVPLEPH